ALKASIENTTFWDNLVARKVGKKAQIAYGHHRYVALKEKYSLDHEIDLIVRDLSDDDMIRVMANENMEEWGATAAITEETIRSVVQAFGDGRIALSPNGRNAPKEGIRHAPSFCTGATLTPGVRVAKAYTAESIAAYLNWWESDGGDKEKGRPPGRRA